MFCCGVKFVYWCHLRQCSLQLAFALSQSKLLGRVLAV